MQSPFFKESFLLLYANSVKVVDFQHQVQVYNALLCLFKQTWYLSLSKNLCFDKSCFFLNKKLQKNILTKRRIYDLREKVLNYYEIKENNIFCPQAGNSQTQRILIQISTNL